MKLQSGRFYQNFITGYETSTHWSGNWARTYPPPPYPLHRNIVRPLLSEGVSLMQSSPRGCLGMSPPTRSSICHCGIFRFMTMTISFPSMSSRRLRFSQWPSTLRGRAMTMSSAPSLTGNLLHLMACLRPQGRLTHSKRRLVRPSASSKPRYVTPRPSPVPLM